MKKAAIISSQYFWLPQEYGPTRFYSIARVMQENGFEVDVITSSFEHHEKKQRDMTLECPFRVVYLNCPSYKKNIGIKREFSNVVFKKKVADFLKNNGKGYDVIYCSLPPNNISAVVGKYCKDNNIPFIADIEDLWPEAMDMIVPKFLRFVFYKYKFDAEKTYKYVDAAVGTSQEYSLRPSKYNNRSIPYRTVYVGSDIESFDNEANENLDKVIKPNGEIWVTYAGSIGHSYAIDNLIKASKLLQDHGLTNIKVKILGFGPLKDEMEQFSKETGCENIEFLGYVPHPLMAAYLVKSDVLINSFAKGASQSIVNKVGDYLAAGKPMINTLENHEMCKLVDDYKFGINVPAEDAKALSEAIKTLSKGNDTMNQNARKLAEQKFDRKTSYKEIIELIDFVCEKDK